MLHEIALWRKQNSAELFDLTFNHVKEKTARLHYYRGSSGSDKILMWQLIGMKKPSQKRSLPPKDELFIVLNKLSLILDKDLAFRLKICQSTVTIIMSTLLPFFFFWRPS